MPALTVTQLVELVNDTLSALELVTVEGEVEGLKVIQGKWVIFDLKDKDSLVRCFMPIWKYRAQVEDGMLVRVSGQPKLRPKGFFSFVLETIQPAGEGALRRAFELLKQKLEGEGLFALERKRPLPRFPHHIALITSREAAAYGDFLKVLRARQGGLTISFIHTAVQGEDAPAQLMAGLSQANTDLPELDAIVMVRGGGSLEDLQAFNDEAVVRAVAASRVPIIVGVGHERDTSLAELAADQRASTPSNAAELLVRSREEIIYELRHFQGRLSQAVQTVLHQQQRRISHSVSVMRAGIGHSRQRVQQQIMFLTGFHRQLAQLVSSRQQRLLARQGTLRQQIKVTIQSYQQRQHQLQRLLQSLSPQMVLRRGYSITRTEKGMIIKQAEALKPGSVINTQLSQGSLTSQVVRPDKKKQLVLGL